MKKIVKAGLLAALVGIVVVLPAQEAGAVTRCREVIRNGYVVKRVCTTTRPVYRYRTVCDTYWRRGVEYRSCRKVRVRVR